MTEFCNLTARNCKLFFKDKGVFFHIADNAAYFTCSLCYIFGKGL